MAQYLIQETTLTGIADAIRSKTGSADAVKVSDMASQIGDITTPVLQEKTVTPTTSVIEVTPDTDNGYNGLSKVTVEAVEGGGGSDGVMVTGYQTADTLAIAFGKSSGTYTFSRVIPSDATDVCAYADVIFSAFNSSGAVIASNFDHQTVIATSDDLTYRSPSNGYRQVIFAEMPFSTTAAVGTSGTIRGKANLNFSFRMPHVRIENNILYADADCEGVFWHNGDDRRYVNLYLEGVDLRGSKVKELKRSTFYGFSELKKVWLSESMTTIGMNVFRDCTGLEELHFTSETPPTVESSYAFTNVPTTCKIYVPAGTLSAYQGKSNYPNKTTYTYVEE